MAKEKNETSTTLHFAPKMKDGVAKETKGTVVYEECNEDGSDKEFGVAIGQLYLQKEFLKNRRPQKFTLTIDL